MSLKNMKIVLLSVKDLDAVMDLQARVLGNIKREYFLKSRFTEDWQKILTSKDYEVFGVWIGKKLIASGTVHFPNGHDERDIPEFQPVPDTDMAIFQSVMVDADYRGMGLMRILQDIRAEATMKRGRGKIICKMSVKNLDSWKNAINYGFHCVRVAKDTTGHEKMYFIKKLKPEENK